MRLLRPDSGFTLIEIIAVIVILAIVLTPFSILVVNVMRQNIYSQALATATSLTEEEMERVTNLRFSAVTNEAAVSFSVPFSVYTHQVIVDYVNANALNTPVAGPTDYKRVQIRVNSSISGTITLTTLVANDW